MLWSYKGICLTISAANAKLLAFISQIYSFNFQFRDIYSKIQTDVVSAVSFAGSIWSCEVSGVKVYVLW